MSGKWYTHYICKSHNVFICKNPYTEAKKETLTNIHYEIKIVDHIGFRYEKII